MSKKRIKELVTLMNDFLRSRGVTVDALVLFGSCAVRTMTKNSDIDIAIVSKSFDGKDVFERNALLRGLQWRLVEEYVLPFDIVPVSRSEWKRSSSPLVAAIRQGKTLHPKRVA